MPIHDWTRVRANRFHDFHQSWTIAIRNRLNQGLLPPGFFAMVEQNVGRPEADVLALELTPPHEGGERVAVKRPPPKVWHVARCEMIRYARKANRVTVRHPDGDVAAVIEIVSPGNKSSLHAARAFARKAVELLEAGIHLLVVDLFPPGKRDPQGIHKLIWDRFNDNDFHLPPDRPLTLAAYQAGGDEVTAYVETVAAGNVLPDMPIYLAPEEYVLCPLETTYQTAWEQYPMPLRGPLESSGT